MKFKFFIITVIGLVYAGCEEKPIEIPDLGTGGRRVLVEDVTGVRCPNCPDGTRELVNLQTSYGSDTLIVVAIHDAGSLSLPYKDSHASKFDFRKEVFGLNDGFGQVVDFIGQPEGYPMAAINRYLQPGSTNTFFFRSAWAGVIADEFKKDYKLALAVVNEYDPATRSLDVEVNINPEKTQSGSYNLSVYITQDSIVDVQLDQTLIIPDYIHRHILRGLLTKPDGNPLNEPLTAGKTITRRFSVTLPATVDDRHASVVAFVHRNGNPDKEVLQVIEKHIIE